MPRWPDEGGRALCAAKLAIPGAHWCCNNYPQGLRTAHKKGDDIVLGPSASIEYLDRRILRDFANGPEVLRRYLRGSSPHALGGALNARAEKRLRPSANLQPPIGPGGEARRGRLKSEFDEWGVRFWFVRACICCEEKRPAGGLAFSDTAFFRISPVMASRRGSKATASLPPISRRETYTGLGL